MNKKGLIGLIAFIMVLLVMGFFLLVSQTGEEKMGCSKIRNSCCPCNMGGSEKCVLLSEVSDYEKKLSECSDGMICAAVYNCKIESCEYVDGECVER